MKKLILLRRLSQGFFLILFIYILWHATYPLKGILPPETFFRTNPSIMIFTSISERILLPGAVISLSMIVLTLILGRFYCGWICPLGTVIDISGSMQRKKKVPKENTNKGLRKVKFFVLGAIFLSALLGVQVAWIFDPMVIMARFVSLNLIPTVTLLLDKFFIFLIKNLNFYGPLYDFYRSLKASFLGVKVHYFANAGVIFLFFLIILGGSFFVSRLWCRMFCPLGALYSVFARASLLRRVVEKCTNCGRCVPLCRMGAIKDDISYVKGECILCMDCVYSCPPQATRFTLALPKTNLETDGRENSGLSRKDFIFLMFSSFFMMAFKWKEKKGASTLIRPPGALKEKDFLNRCIRCGNCKKVCPTNGLQPAMLQSGIEGIWTPHLVPEIGYCEYNCALCSSVCPTGAIPKLPLDKKKKTSLGTAKVDRSICIAWAYNQECLVCEEHCPVPEKAIKIIEEVVDGRVVQKPYVDPKLCIGCGICQTKCPVRPVRAIKVNPSTAERT